MQLRVGNKLKTNRWRVRRAVVSLEFILAAPVLVIAVMAAVVFGSILTVHHAVIAAATEGAREGAKVPTDLGAFDAARVLDAVEETIETVLASHGLTVGPGSGVMVIVEDSTGIDCRGEAIIACPMATSITDPAEVQVTVLVDLQAANIPNLLISFCIDLEDRYFELCSVSRRDCR